MEVEIQFANEKIKIAFEKLNSGKYEEKQLYEWIKRAFEDIKKNAFSGIQIPTRLIPKEYIKKYGIHNLFKYNLPDAWRLLYSKESTQVCILSIILEWLDHKEYERRFGF